MFSITKSDLPSGKTKLRFTENKLQIVSLESAGKLLVTLFLVSRPKT